MLKEIPNKVTHGISHNQFISRKNNQTPTKITMKNSTPYTVRVLLLSNGRNNPSLAYDFVTSQSNADYCIATDRTKFLKSETTVINVDEKKPSFLRPIGNLQSKQVTLAKPNTVQPRKK
jgi:hypothetical protein